MEFTSRLCLIGSATLGLILLVWGVFELDYSIVGLGYCFSGFDKMVCGGLCASVCVLFFLGGGCLCVCVCSSSLPNQLKPQTAQLERCPNPSACKLKTQQ